MTRRVVHVASGREWRGGERQVWLLCRALHRLGGLDQIVVTAHGSELERRLIASGLPVRGVPWRAGLDPRALLAIYRQSRQAPSLIHAHDPHALVLAGPVTRWTSGKLVTTRRTNFPLRRPGAWRRADRVLAISTAVRDTLLKGTIEASRISVVPSGVAVEEVRAAPRLEVRARLGLPAGTPIAASVGALSREKGHHTLVETAERWRERLPDLHWVIAGEGKLRRSLELMVRSRRLDDRLHFLGQIPEGAQLIADASVLVSTAEEEGLGIAILEALALGVPVVATRVGGVPDLLEGGAGLLVPPRDPDVLGAAVERLLRDTSLYESCRAAAARTISRFTDHGMAAATLSVYRSLDSIP